MGVLQEGKQPDSSHMVPELEFKPRELSLVLVVLFDLFAPVSMSCALYNMNSSKIIYHMGQVLFGFHSRAFIKWCVARISFIILLHPSTTTLCIPCS